MNDININDKVRIVSICNSYGEIGIVTKKYKVGMQDYVVVQLKDRKQGYNVLSTEKVGSEEYKMKEYKNIAIVNLLEDWKNKDYGFALYESELRILHDGDLVVINAGGKNRRVLGMVKEIMTTEEYGKGVSAQVVGVVNMEAYNKRIEKEEHLKEIAKQKAVIEKELKAEIEKMNNIALYEKMAKEHPENPRLLELVNALKELGK